MERRDVRSPRGDGAWRGNPPQGSGGRRGKPAAQNVVVPQQQPPFPRLRRGSSGDHRPDYGQNSWGSDPKEQVAKAYPYPPPPRRSSPPRDPRRQAQASAPPHVVGPYGAAEQPPMPYGQETQAYGYGTVNGLQGEARLNAELQFTVATRILIFGNVSLEEKRSGIRTH